MAKPKRDHSLDVLLELHGQTFFIEEEGRYWVKFKVVKCDVIPERPHGLDYSLTLHGSRNERLVGFDNAHPVSKTKGPARKKKQKYDHKHRLRTIRPYEYRDAAQLLADFWKEVDEVLKELGVRT